MKRKLFHFLRVACLIALFVLTFMGMMRLSEVHQAACPELYVRNAPQSYWPIIAAVIAFLLTPLVVTGCGLLSGYRLVEVAVLFLHVTKEDRLRIRLGRPGLGTAMLPPRVDGTSPFRLVQLSRPLYAAFLAALFLLLLFPCWETNAFRTLMLPLFFYFAITLVWLLPRRNALDPLSLTLAFSRSRDLRRAWECAMHVSHALSKDQTLPDMPDEWFQTYPAGIAHHFYVALDLINGSSRLIRQGRYEEAYEQLILLSDLPSTPENHNYIACAIVHGTICEALTGRPACFADRLEEDAVQYMLLEHWQPRLALARYARALLIRRDDAQAAALLPEVEKSAVAGEAKDQQAAAALFQAIQQKAGGENA